MPALRFPDLDRDRIPVAGSDSGGAGIQSATYGRSPHHIHGTGRTLLKIASVGVPPLS